MVKQVDGAGALGGLRIGAWREGRLLGKTTIDSWSVVGD